MEKVALDFQEDGGAIKQKQIILLADLESRHWNITIWRRKEKEKWILGLRKNLKGELQSRKVKIQTSMQKKKLSNCTLFLTPGSQHERGGSSLQRHNEGRWLRGPPQRNAAKEQSSACCELHGEWLQPKHTLKRLQGQMPCHVLEGSAESWTQSNHRLASYQGSKRLSEAQQWRHLGTGNWHQVGKRHPDYYTIKNSSPYQTLRGHDQPEHLWNWEHQNQDPTLIVLKACWVHVAQIWPVCHLCPLVTVETCLELDIITKL